jgi:hypothetical protein
MSKEALGLPFSDNKYRLSEVCLRSFRESLGTLRVKIWALLDGCSDEYETLFRNCLGSDDLVILRFDRIGNRATFGKQIDILLEQRDADVVYFAEDDYFYLPGQFSGMLEFLTECSGVDFVAPYDHWDGYRLELHRTPEQIRFHTSHHWRTAASTCLTFLTRKKTLAKYEAVFRSYQRRQDDCALWLTLTKHRVFNPLALWRHLAGRFPGWRSLVKAWLYGWPQVIFGRRASLWTPIPSIATHLNRSLLSPNVDWSALMQQGAEASSTGAWRASKDRQGSNSRNCGDRNDRNASPLR